MSNEKAAGDPELQILPFPSAGFGEQYSTVPRPIEDTSITNIGGFDALGKLLVELGLEQLSGEIELADVDSLIIENLRRFRGMGEELGMYYGNFLTHNIPKAHWIRDPRGKPEVRIAPIHTVDVQGVANRRLINHFPSLAQNFDHVRRLASAAKEDG